MKRVCILIFVLLLIVSLSAGCQLKNIPFLKESDETDISDNDHSPGGNEESDQETDLPDANIGDPISDDTYDQIDWNLDAYSEYFCVISDSAVIHYWNGGSTILASFPGILMYVSTGPMATSITVDLDTGNISEGEGSMMMPNFGQMPDAEMPTQTLGYMGTDNFEGWDVIVYSADVEGGTASYFVNRANLTCIGWTYVSSAGSVTYAFGENPEFEDVVDAIFESEKDLPDDSEGDPDYSDSDGDGFSNWNEDRLPTLEELDDLKDIWKSEGMSQAEFIKQFTVLFPIE
jgi:hypothetical protein